MTRLAIYGCGGFGREIVPIVEQHMTYRRDAGLPTAEVVFIDDLPSASHVLGLRVLTLDELTADDWYVIAVADCRKRLELDQKCLARGLIPSSIYSDTYKEGREVEIADGAIFCHNTMVTASASIGRQFHCNSYSYVSHDCTIGDYVTFAPRVSCSGNVQIGDMVSVGAGAVIKQGTPAHPLVIGRGAVIGMGAVVTKSVAEGETVVGIPAKPHQA